MKLNGVIGLEKHPLMFKKVLLSLSWLLPSATAQVPANGRGDGGERECGSPPLSLFTLSVPLPPRLQKQFP